MTDIEKIDINSVEFEHKLIIAAYENAKLKDNSKEDIKQYEYAYGFNIRIIRKQDNDFHRRSFFSIDIVDDRKGYEEYQKFKSFVKETRNDRK